MQTNTSVKMFDHSPNSAVNKATTSQKIGFIIFGIGAIYMIVVSWMATWWVVPTMREIGLDGFSATIMIWAVSAPLGALIVAIGAALIGSMAQRRFWLWIAGSIVVVIWLAMGAITEIVSALFGIGGGLIIAFFLGVTWNWASIRPRLSAAAKSAADLQMIGQVFFLIAAWNLCGLLGAPSFILRPEVSQQFDTLALATGLGTTVLICLAIGWGCMFWSQRMNATERFEMG